MWENEISQRSKKCVNFQIEGPEILKSAGNSKLKFQKYQKVRENKVAKSEILKSAGNSKMKFQKYQKVRENKVAKY